MAAKTQLEILGKKLEEAELLLVTMEDAKVLPPDMLSDYFNTRLVPYYIRISHRKFVLM